MKDQIDDSISIVKQHTDDVYESAKDIYNQEEKANSLEGINFNAEEKLLDNDDKL